MTTTLKSACIAAILTISIGPTSVSWSASTLRLSLNGNTITGTPLAWSDSSVLVLGRDGYLWEFSPQDASDFTQVSNTFRPFSQSEMRGELLREFGKKFDVSGTGNYLVVHPVGGRDQWALRFERLYRSFVRYFSVRGFLPSNPSLPLVAVVFHSQPEFSAYVRELGGNVHPNTLGFYSTASNRIILFDVTAGQSNDDNWYVNADTIIHEATHQMAFNTGVHGRSAPPPIWVAEGLATLFEAPGVWNSHQHRDQSDRINRGRLAAFKRYVDAGRKKGSLTTFIQNSDRFFQTAPSIAYAEAWAFTYFLTETDPAKYMKYVAKTAARKPLVEYRPKDQLQEFTDIFGTNLNMIEARFLRFLAQQK